jgi:serine/threonine protein kinase
MALSMQTENLATHQNGDILQGRYRIIRLIGKGGFGEVFEASDEQLSRPVAVKVLLNPDQNTAAGQERARRFVNEAKITAQIKHHAIPVTFDMGKLDNGALYLVTELLRGESLSDLLKRQTLGLAESLRCLSEISACLAVAHQVGILHRDIKPSNIFLNYEGNKIAYKLLDFGIAKIYNDTQMEGIDEEKTQDGLFIGSPHYMAPERFSKKREYDQRSDLYSLGVVFYRCLSGRCPYLGETLVDIAMAHMREPIPQVSLDEKEYLPYRNIVQALLESMLVKDANHRIADAQLLNLQAQSLLSLMMQNQEPPSQLIDLSASYPYGNQQSSVTDMRMVGKMSQLGKNPSFTPNSISPPSAPFPNAELVLPKEGSATPPPFVMANQNFNPNPMYVAPYEENKLETLSQNSGMTQRPKANKLLPFLLIIPIVLVGVIIFKKVFKSEPQVAKLTISSTIPNDQNFNPNIQNANDLNAFNQGNQGLKIDEQKDGSAQTSTNNVFPELRPIQDSNPSNPVTELKPIDTPNAKSSNTSVNTNKVAVSQKDKAKKEKESTKDKAKKEENVIRQEIKDLFKKDQDESKNEEKAPPMSAGPKKISLQVSPLKAQYFVGEKIRMQIYDENREPVKMSMLVVKSDGLGLVQQSELKFEKKGNTNLMVCVKGNPKVCSEGFPLMVNELE